MIVFNRYPDAVGCSTKYIAPIRSLAMKLQFRIRTLYLMFPLNATARLRTLYLMFPLNATAQCPLQLLTFPLFS